MSARMVMWYAPLWAIGLAVLWWPLATLQVLRRRRELRRPPFMLQSMLALLAASLLVPVLLLEDMNRLPGAAFNLSVWLLLVLVCSASERAQQAHALKVGLVNLSTIQSLVVLGAYALPVLRSVPLGVAALLPESVMTEPSLATFASNRVLILDYFNGEVLRAGGIFGNPTWAAGLTATSLIILGLDRRLRSLVRPWLVCLILLLQVTTLWLTYSRASLLGAVAALTVGALWMQRRRLLRILGGLVAACVAIGMYQGGESATRPLAAINDQRAGSLISRSEIYAATLERVELPSGLVVGQGVKARGEGLVASYGSHSTYLGLAYRGGIAAAVAYLALNMSMLRRAMSQRNGLAVGLVTFVMLWSAVEDLDTGHLAALALACAWLLVATPVRCRTGMHPTSG